MAQAEKLSERITRYTEFCKAYPESANISAEVTFEYWKLLAEELERQSESLTMADPFLKIAKELVELNERIKDIGFCIARIDHNLAPRLPIG